MDQHKTYMRRCIEIAANGLGTTYPNPLVGSVIVHDGKIIGEGWHRKSGEPHAEVIAINSVQNKDLLEKSTMYVSLEPCSHFGKTPPCCDLILEKNIPEIIVGTIDPFALVSGAGIAKLKSAGRNVIVGILESECRELNKRFFTFHQKKRPYIILKWAESRDGFIAPEKRDKAMPFPISNVFSRQLVHKWRSEEQGILIGTQTAVDDNPVLNVRNWSGNNPVRIVIDKSNRIPKENHIFGSHARTIVLTERIPDNAKDFIEYRQMRFASNLAQEIADALHSIDVQSVIIEGGQRTLQTFIDAGLWDEARVFKSNMVLASGIQAPHFNAAYNERMSIAQDELLIFRNHD